MNDRHGMNGRAARTAARQRKMRLSPVTRAVRSALAASAAMIALAGVGPALAGDCTAPVNGTIRCNGDFADTLNFSVEDLTLVVGDEAASTIAPPPGSPGILADWAGSIGVVNHADIVAYADGIDAIGSGDIDVANDGDIDVAAAGQVIGIYAYTDGGDVTIANGGDIGAYSMMGLADGIFASGANVSVSNSGAIDADGYSWAAGIEAQGAGATSVSNDGSILAYSYAAGSYAFGIYATGTDVTVANGGDVEAQGYYANGVYVQSGGSASIDNAGSVVAGGLYTSLYASGIHAASGGLDSDVSVTSSGDVSVSGYAGAVGIEALATGAGSTASVANSGDVYVNSYYKYAGGSSGVVASADGDAAVANSGGIESIAGGSAYGAMALSFNGEASVVNSGDISASSTAFLYYGAYGIVSASQNGAASAANSGGITISASLNHGIGIDVEGFAGASATNAGAIDVDAKYAYGVFARAGDGDVSVTNEADGAIGVYSGLGYATGLFGLSAGGDVALANDGDIAVDGYSQGVGFFGRASLGDSSATNTGTIYAHAYGGAAVGIYANAPYGTVTVDNSGSIEAVGPAPYGVGVAFGILANGDTTSVTNAGDVAATGYIQAIGIDTGAYDLATVVNSGTGVVTATALGNARGIAATGAGGVSVANAGSVGATSAYLDAIGIYAYSYGNVDVANDGDVTAIAPYGLADGIFASGANTTVTNGTGGAILAAGYGWAAGIEAQGTESADVANAGDIIVQTLGPGEGFGIYAAGGEAGATNSGIVYVRGYDQATGIYARGDVAATVANSGGVYAGYYDNGFSSSYAIALMAVTGGEGSGASIDNSGDLQALSFASSSGAEARALGAGGSADVTNSGDVVAVAFSTGGSAAGLVATADGDATIDNSGTLTTLSGGMAYGALAAAFNGEASVTNSGDIVSINNAFPYYSAYGIVSSSQNGSASAGNSGSIYAYSPYIGVGMAVVGMQGATAENSGDIESNAWVSYGIRASSGQGDVSVGNSGSILAHYAGFYSPYLAFGVRATTVGGDIALDNSGDIATEAAIQSFGLFASTTSGDISVDNSGTVVSASATNLAAPIFATNANGDVDVQNSGSLAGYSATGPVAGAFARASLGTASITNSGDIGAATAGTAYGVLVRGYYAEAHNSGSVEASGGAAYGVYVDGTIYGTVENSGQIAASTEDGHAFGVMAIGLYGAAVYNSGDITASAGEAGLAVGVMAQAYYDVFVENSGTISASHPDVAIAVRLYSAAGTATLDNSGTLATDTSSGGSIAVLGSNGDNVIRNSGDIYGTIVTFGGDDAIGNAAGGTIHLEDGGIYLGGSRAAGNSFVNNGTLRVSDFGLVDMGTAPSSLDANPLPMVNNGIIDFVDGSPDDMLVILGDLGGSGAINLDLSVLNGGADQLYVDGDVVGGTTQAINLAIDGVPTALQGTATPVATVTGTIAPGSFVGGRVLNVDASNFLDLGVRLATAPAGGASVLSAAVDVEGLNRTGVLGASVAQGMRNLVDAAVGTRSQRSGLLPPPGDGRRGISPWLRIYNGNGNVSPASAGFGSGADFGFRQENRGRELGIDVAATDKLSVGLMGGNADGDLVLSGGGGNAHLKQHGMGFYGTWTDSRFYVDASYRTMDIEARLHSAGGEMETSARASSINLEAGLTGWSAAGVDVVPQLQYTRSKINGIAPLIGSQARMASDGGTSSRGRVGVALSRSFDAGSGYSWTPYGALSVVREFDGRSGFTVADAFSGTTAVDGTSTLAELGVAVRHGGFSATAGLHWMDGGAVDDARGGQVVLRYSW